MVTGQTAVVTSAWGGRYRLGPVKDRHLMCQNGNLERGLRMGSSMGSGRAWGQSPCSDRVLNPILGGKQNAAPT